MDPIKSFDELDQLVKPSLAPVEETPLNINYGEGQPDALKKRGRPKLAPGEKGKSWTKKTPRKPRPSELAKKAVAPVPKVTGGFNNYYLVEVKEPQRGGPPMQVECEDVIEALDLNFDEANIFKEIWRSARQRQGTGKPGHSPVYGAEKIVHYANRILRRIKRSV